jgi:hypothetical protein
VGELKKLGHTVATTSVKRISLEHGIHPTPEKNQKRQPPMPWGQFLQSHMESLVACDFFTKPVHTLRGRFDAFCLVYYNTERPHRGKDIGNRVLNPDFKAPTTGWSAVVNDWADSSRATTGRLRKPPKAP